MEDKKDQVRKGVYLMEMAIIGLLGTILGAIIVAGFDWMKSRQERVNQLRLAALEKRLAAHQRAYTLSNKLMWNLSKEELSSILLNCQDWYENNCLYLDSKSRSSFKEAFITSSILLSSPDDRETKRQCVELIEKARAHIVKGAGLPTIGEYEGKRINEEP